MNFRFFLFLILTIILNVGCDKNTSKLDTTIFKEKHQENKVLSQYYRWYQTFEREQNDKRIANHLDILSNDVLIKTSSRTMNGKEGMKGFLDYVKEWKNAHHIENTSVTQNDDGTLSLEADILYQNILPDSTKNNYKLHYSTTLNNVNNQLPIFTKLELLPTSTVENVPYKDAYIENRSKSLIYYWISLMDDIKGNESKFDQLLTSSYKLQFPTSLITNDEELQRSLKEIDSRMITSLHTPKNIKSTINTDGTISVSLDFEWKGITNEEEKLIAEIHHEWILENNLDEPYARIKEIKINQTKPFLTVGEF